MSERENQFQQIECAMVSAQQKIWRGIQPIDLAGWLPVDWTTKQVFYLMEAMVKRGRLVKVGVGPARGYRLATGSQRQAFAEKYALRPRGQISVSDYTELVYEAIENAVAKAYRDLGRGVLPKDIQARLPYGRAEGSLRRDMLAMWSAGRLVRVAGQGARQGYRPPTRIEKLAFVVNQGMWPHGAEFVVGWS